MKALLALSLLGLKELLHTLHTPRPLWTALHWHPLLCFHRSWCTVGALGPSLWVPPSPHITGDPLP